MEDKQNSLDPNDNSLEAAETVQQQPTITPISSGGESLDPSKGPGVVNPQDQEPHLKPKKSIAQKVQALVGGLNIYVLLFGLILLLAGIATFASYRASKIATNLNEITGQELTAEDLKNLKSNDTTVGDSKQTLTIASNAVFNGRVLVRDSLDIAGSIRVGGTLSLPGITVSGTSAFENVQVANNLSVAGNGAVQGTMTVQKNLSVGGSGSFGGTLSAPTISVDQLILNRDLVINRHIDAGGGTPRVSGYGTSISGSDTAGTVSIAGGSFSGTLARITFANRFNQTPHVVITPIGGKCATKGFYVDEITTSGFIIGIVGSESVRCSFNYMVID